MPDPVQGFAPVQVFVDNQIPVKKITQNAQISGLCVSDYWLRAQGWIGYALIGQVGDFAEPVERACQGFQLTLGQGI